MSIDPTKRPVEPFYERNGILISEPRMFPEALADGRTGVDYEYSFLREGSLVAGLGFSGIETVIQDATYNEQVFTIDLGTDAALSSILKCKPRLGSQDDDFTYLLELAHGLVSVFEREKRSPSNRRYVAFTRIEVLARFGISGANHLISATDGRLVLAEAFLPQYVE